MYTSVEYNTYILTLIYPSCPPRKHSVCCEYTLEDLSYYLFMAYIFIISINGIIHNNGIRL